MAVSPTQPQPYCGLKVITVDLQRLGVAQKEAAARLNKADALLRGADEVVAHKSDSEQSKEVSFSTKADRVVSYIADSRQSGILQSLTNENCMTVVREKYDGEVIGKAAEIIDLNRTDLDEKGIVKRILDANSAGKVTYAIKRGSDSFVLIVELIA